MNSLTLRLALLVGLLSAALTTAQQIPSFGASAELVHVVVSVVDSSGQPVRGLTASDFSVSEDGHGRQVESVSACAEIERSPLADCPVDMALLFDTSQSMKADSLRARDEALAFMASVPAARGRLLVSFNSNVTIAPFDDDDPTRALEKAMAGEDAAGTRFFDAILKSIDSLEANSPRRPIILVLTDGEDTEIGKRTNPVGGLPHDQWLWEVLENQQSHPTPEIVTALQNASVSLYAISFADQRGRDRTRVDHAENNLRALTKSTGGFVVDGMKKDLEGEFAKTRNDIAAQYVLAFTPGSSTPGVRHKLKVTVRTKGAKVRHREAYQTPASLP